MLTELFDGGRTPYEDMSNNEVWTRVNEGYRMPRPHGCPSDVYDLMLHCWDVRVAQRPRFTSIGEFFALKLKQGYSTLKIGLAGPNGTDSFQEAELEEPHIYLKLLGSEDEAALENPDEAGNGYLALSDAEARPSAASYSLASHVAPE